MRAFEKCGMVPIRDWVSRKILAHRDEPAVDFEISLDEDDEAVFVDGVHNSEGKELMILDISYSDFTGNNSIDSLLTGTYFAHKLLTRNCPERIKRLRDICTWVAFPGIILEGIDLVEIRFNDSGRIGWPFV